MPTIPRSQKFIQRPPACSSLVRMVLCALAVGTGFMLVVGESNAVECISEEARAALTSCSGVVPKQLSRKPGIRLVAAPGGAKRGRTVKPVDGGLTGQSELRDPRRERLEPKVFKLLLAEIASVETLYRRTPDNDPDRPRLMRRLAEGYVELESGAFRERVDAEVRAKELRQKNPELAAKYNKDASRATKIINTARKSAIQYYKQLNAQFPNWCQFPNNPPETRGCNDEVLYYLAYEYEQAGNFDKARAAYLELTEQHTTSRFVPNAYLAFGELFFNEAQGDPGKWPYAANFYKEVLKHPPPQNKLYGYAAYKLAYVYWNQAEADKALDQFKAVIEFGKKYPHMPNAPGLAASARRDLIPVYALRGNAAQAYTFFRPLSGDQGGRNEATVKMMEELGQQLLDTGHYAQAILLYKDLMQRDRGGDRHCAYQARVSEAVMAQHGGNKDPIVAELRRQLAEYKSFAAARHDEAAKLRCANDSASLLTETAMAWHLEAVGSGDVRGTNDSATMSYSGELYQLVVDHFTPQQFQQFKFPRIVKDDWPDLAKVRFAQANLAYYQKDWKACGPAFDAVLAQAPTGPLAAEAAYAAALCYQELYLSKHADGADRQPRPDVGATNGTRAAAPIASYQARAIGTEQKAMIGAFDRFICHIKPADQDRDAMSQYVEVKFARARTYYEAQHWEEAALAFRDIAVHHPDADVAVYAAQLYLHSLEIMESKLEPPRAACGEMMRADVPSFIKSFCGSSQADRADDCAALARIERNLTWRQAERLVKECDESKAPHCPKQYEKAGDLFYGLWKSYGEAPCQAYAKAAEDKAAEASCARNDEILYNAARAFQAARLIAKAIDVRRILISDSNGLAQTELAKRAVFEIGGNYQAIAVYDLAAGWYERFARDYPSMPQAPEALSDAVVLRLGLGDRDKAIADARLFNLKYGRSQPAQSAQVSFAIGAHYAERDSWREAERALSQSMQQIDQHATADVQIQAHALLGRCYAKMNQRARADREYGRVRASWRDPAAMVATINSAEGATVGSSRRLGKALLAVGESHYYFADKLRAKADHIVFPSYKGSGERQDVDRFIKSKVREWMATKRTAIQSADAEYQKILALKPQPPPKWIIKSGAAVGAMWGRFAADFRTAPYPKQWDSAGFIAGTEPPLLWAELRATYINELVAASKREMLSAKGAYEACLAYSLRFQYFDEDSRACEEWLSRSYPNEHHLIDEFRGAPTRINSALDERPLALNIGGAPRTDAAQP